MKMKSILAVLVFVLGGCGGDDGGGNSPASGSPTPSELPILQAPSDQFVNVRAIGEMEAVATTRDGKPAQVEWIWRSGPKVIKNNRSPKVTYHASNDPGQSIYDLVAIDPYTGLSTKKTVTLNYAELDIREYLKREPNQLTARVGLGYDQELDVVKINQCVLGDTTHIPYSSIQATQSLVTDVEEIYKRLEGSLSGNVGFETLALTSSLNYVSEERNRVANAAYALNIQLTAGSNQLEFDPLGVGLLKEKPEKTLKENWAEFRALCGDAVITEQTLGANLYVILSVKFGSASEKEAFEMSADFDVSSLGSMSSSLSYLSEYSQNGIETELSIFAEGGDVSLVLDAMPKSENFLKCHLGYQECIESLATLQNIIVNTSSYAQSLTQYNAAVLESKSTPYGSVAFNVELSDVVLTKEEIEAKEKVANLRINEYANFSYFQRFNKEDLTEYEYNLYKEIADSFAEDLAVSQVRVELAEEAYTNCLFEPMDCDSIHNELLSNLESNLLHDATWPFILHLNTDSSGLTSADVWCLPPIEKDWVIVDVGIYMNGHQYYEANPSYLKVREVNQDTTLGDVRILQCKGGNGREGSSTPITTDVGGGGYFVEESQLPSRIHWLENPDYSYVLTHFRARASTGDKNHNRWLSAGGTFTKYQDGKLLSFWTHDVAWTQDYNFIRVSTELQNVTGGHTKYATAKNGGWLTSLSLQRNKGGSAPIEAWSTIPYQ